MTTPCAYGIRLVVVALDDVLKTLERDGYAVLRGTLSPAEIAAVHAEVERWLAATPTGRNAFEGFRTQRVYNLAGKSRVFDPLIERPLVVSLCDAVLAPQYQLSSAVAICPPFIGYVDGRHPARSLERPRGRKALRRRARGR